MMGVLLYDKFVGFEKLFVDVLYVIVGNVGSVIMVLLVIFCLFGMMFGWILFGFEVFY